MNVMQRIVLIAAALLITWLVLYPPFVRSDGSDRGHSYVTTIPTEPFYDRLGTVIEHRPCRHDSFRLGVYILAAVATGGVLTLAFRGEK